MLPFVDRTPPQQAPKQPPARQPRRQRSGGSDAERLAKRARTTEDAEEAGAGAGGTVEGAPGAPEDAAMTGAGDAVVGEEVRPEEEEDKDRQEQEEDGEAKQAKKAAQLADEDTQI